MNSGPQHAKAPQASLEHGRVFPIPFTTFSELTNPQGHLEQWDTIDSLRSWLFEPVVGAASKDRLPMWSPFRFTGHQRNKQNAWGTQMLVFDVDTPCANMNDFGARIGSALGTSCWAHSTFTSSADAMRARVLVPLSRFVTHEQYPPLWNLTQQMLTIGGIEVDASCRDIARAYYVPAQSLDGTYECTEHEAVPFDVERALSLLRPQVVEASTISVRRRSNSDPPNLNRARAYLQETPAAIAGDHGHDATFRAAQTLVKGFALSIADAIPLLREWNLSCTPPWDDDALIKKLRDAETSSSALGYLL